MPEGAGFTSLDELPACVAIRHPLDESIECPGAVTSNLGLFFNVAVSW